MSFSLPNLDRKNYQQLVAELMRRIPEYTRQWTDYNDSDPGMTLLQMLAWLDESLLYQANQIPLPTYDNFLRTVLGLAFSDNTTAYSRAAVADNDGAFLELVQVLREREQGAVYSKAALQRHVLSYLAQPYLALSLASVETLTMEANGVITHRPGHAGPAPLLVQRAYAREAHLATTVFILSNAKPQYHYPPYPNRAPSEPGSWRKLLMHQFVDDTKAEQTLLGEVGAHLAPRVIAGSRVVARPVQFTALNLSLELVCAPDASPPTTLALLFARLFIFFLPCEGGVQGKGWQYGVAPALADISQLVLSMPGVARIDRLDMTFIATLQLNVMATLDVDAGLADLPAGAPGLFYHGLPRLRCLDVVARSSPA